LRGNPVEKFPRAGLVGRPACGKGFFRLRENLFLEEFCMVIRRLDLLQLIAEQPEGFLLHALQLGLRGGEVALGPFGSRGVFSVVYPRDAEGDARVKFARKMLGVVISLALHVDRGIGNPIATGKLHFFLLGLACA
jgi:hypothetical protein